MKTYLFLISNKIYTVTNMCSAHLPDVMKYIQLDSETPEVPKVLFDYDPLDSLQRVCIDRYNIAQYDRVKLNIADVIERLYYLRKLEEYKCLDYL